MGRLISYFALFFSLNVTSHGWARAELPTTIDLALDSPTATLTGAYPLGWSGGSTCVALINGDSWPDIVIASCRAKPMSGLRTGELTILWGSYPGLSGTVQLSSTEGMSHIFGPSSGDPVNCNVATGDFNGDGYDDILWGHPGSPSPQWFGKVFLIPGGDSFPTLIDLQNPPAGVVVITGHVSLGRLGRGLASADFNGDQIDDVVISAPDIPHSEIYVINGSPSLQPFYWTGNNASGMTRIVDVELDRETGYSIAAGDLDDDGRDDLVLGAPGVGGRISILHGAVGLDDTVTTIDSNLRAKIITPEFVDGQLGQDVAIGDVDNNGQLDIAISSVSGAPMGCDGCGAVYVVKGAASMPDTLSLLTSTYPFIKLYGSGTFTYYGLNVTFANIDGDHKDDLVVSNWPVLENERARTVIAFASGLTSTTHMLALDPSFTRIIEKKIGDRMGSSLSAADLNRDGLDDLLVGALSADPPMLGNAGEIYLINGCYVVSGIETPSIGNVSLRNVPNPFTGQTTITIELLSESAVLELAIYDVRGKFITELQIPQTPSSTFSVPWNGKDARGNSAPTGVYFVRLVTAAQTFSRKMLLLR